MERITGNPEASRQAKPIAVHRTGLFLRTLRNLQNQDYGFERSHLLPAEFKAKLAGYKPSQTPGLHQRLVERFSALPGVRSVAP